MRVFRKPTDIIKQVVAEAKVASYYILQELGPTAFLLKSNEKKFKVLIGQRQTCSCHSFDLCSHIVSRIMIDMGHVKDIPC